MAIKYPKNEIVWVSYRNIKGETIAILTSKQTLDCYYLYEVNRDGSLLKLGKARFPPEIEERFDIKSRMMV